jgi:hypothetical protein
VRDAHLNVAALNANWYEGDGSMPTTPTLPHWDLTTVYPSLESPEFVQGFAQVVQDIHRLAELFDLHFIMEQPAITVNASVGQTFELIDELNNLMLEAQRETYADGLDESLLHPYMWAMKPHYYSTGRSFYNYPYMFGLLFGLGLYARYQQDPETFKAATMICCHQQVWQTRQH